MAKDKPVTKYVLVKFDEIGPKNGVEFTPHEYVRLVSAVRKTANSYMPDRNDNLREKLQEILKKLDGLL